MTLPMRTYCDVSQWELPSIATYATTGVGREDSEAASGDMRRMSKAPEKVAADIPYLCDLDYEWLFTHDLDRHMQVLVSYKS